MPDPSPLHGGPALVPARSLARRVARAGLAAADALSSMLTPHRVRTRPSLTVMALHALCPDRASLHHPALAPGQAVCAADLRALVESVLESGCRIVGPAQLEAGLPPHTACAMLTFDDGYFNNVLALDVLREFGVPATFFVASGPVLEGKCFWWDALARELAQARAAPGTIASVTRRLKRLSVARIEAWLRARFGDDVLQPRGDADRPFTERELAAFARDPLVHIGNHTADHEILTNCTPDEARTQIGRCQETLRAITGRTPIAIAYPNGDHSPAVVEAARAAGLRLGFTVEPRRNPLPAPAAMASMRLARFYFEARPDAGREFRACRGGFVPSRVLRRLLPA